jgi:myo-inositol 2-dehydrogenase/D-chiro-inositol 1-dehydrogenase
MAVRYGLIGYGRWGAWHSAAIRKTEGAELRAVAVSSTATAEKVRRELGAAGVEVYTDYESLLARDDIDVIDVVLPNYLHYDVAVKALRAGKHLLLEKPLALTVQHCREIMALAEEKRRIVHVGHELRFSPLWGRVKQLIDEGKLGRLKSANIQLSRHPFRGGADGWRKDLGRVGSWILEEPVHFFDLLRWYFAGSGEPVSLFAVGNSRERQLEDGSLYENLSSLMTFEDGGFASFNQTLAAYEHHLSAEWIGTQGVLKLWWSGATDDVPTPQFRMDYYDGEKVQSIEIEKTPGEVYELDQQVRSFTETVRNGGQPTVSAEDGLWAVKLSLAAQKSVELGGKVIDLRDEAALG